MDHLGYQPRFVMCAHMDNFGRCRVHTAPRWIRWLLPKGRPPCIFRSFTPQPQDGALECPDQLWPEAAPLDGKR